MSYFKKAKENIYCDELYEKVRAKLKLTEKELPDATIRKVIKLNGDLIGDWIVNNADGFKIKDNGILIVSKWLPKCLRGEKLDKIQEILDNPLNDDYMKEMFISRYNKSIEYHKDFSKPKGYHINLESFFYLYRIMWFNSRNCAFDKAELYEIEACYGLKQKLNKKIISGKDYFEWNFSDFRKRKNKEKEERVFMANKKRLEKEKNK